MTDFLHNHPWITNFVIGVLGAVSAITLNQIMVALTILLTCINIYIRVRDAIWRDPVRVKRREAAKRAKARRRAA